MVKAVTSGLDGTIYIGESERISRLYLLYPVSNELDFNRGQK